MHTRGHVHGQCADTTEEKKKILYMIPTERLHSVLKIGIASSPSLAPPTMFPINNNGKRNDPNLVTPTLYCGLCQCLMSLVSMTTGAGRGRLIVELRLQKASVQLVLRSSLMAAATVPTGLGDPAT